MMIRGAIALALILFLLYNISAQCNETQIDINSANLTELDKIKWVGLPTAEKIVELRPFSSLDELVNVSGISEGRVEEIKVQGLACVNEEAEEVQNTENNSEPEKIINNETKDVNDTEQEREREKGNPSITSNAVENVPKDSTETINLTPISLNIKSEDNKEVLKKNLALYGIITFCMMFGALFFLKQARRKKENEFR